MSELGVGRESDVGPSSFWKDSLTPRRSDQAHAGQRSVFGQESSWGTPSNSEAWSFSSPGEDKATSPLTQRLIRRQRFVQVLIPILLGLAFAGEGFRFGLASSGHSVVSAV